MNLKSINGSSIHHKLSTHRLTVIVIAVTLLIVGVYIAWSKYTWDEYEVKYGQWHTTMQSQIDAALALPAASDKERHAKFTALKGVSNTIRSARTSLCPVNILVGWQRIIEGLRTKEGQCHKIVDASVAFNQKLEVVINYLEKEEALAAIIRGVSGAKAELAESDWEMQAAAWHEAAVKIEKLASNPGFDPTKQVARDTTVKLDAAWQEFLAAHKAKDKDRYLKAQAQLADAYGSLGDVSGAGTKQLKILLDPLQLAYMTAFK